MESNQISMLPPVTEADIALFNASSTFELALTKGSVKGSMAVDGKLNSSADLWKVPVNSIKVIPGFNARIKTPKYWKRVREIADSIIANGFYPSQALLIYPGKDATGNNVPFLIDGHRRFDGVLLAISEGHKIEVLPCVTTPDHMSLEKLTYALIHLNADSRLEPFEEAGIYARGIKFGATVEEVALEAGKSATHVKNMLELFSAPRSIHALVNEGSVSATLAIDTIKKHGSEASKVLVAGKEKAKAQGKERVTAKTLKPAAEKVPKADTAGRVEKPAKRDLLQVATDWLARNVDIASTDKRFFELVGLLCEVNPNEIEGRVQFKLKEVTPDTALAAATAGEVQLDLAPDVLN